MIAKKLFFTIIFIHFFQYVRERNLNYFHHLQISKKNVLMHRPVAKDRPWLSRQQALKAHCSNICNVQQFVFKGQTKVMSSNSISLDPFEWTYKKAVLFTSNTRVFCFFD